MPHTYGTNPISCNQESSITSSSSSSSSPKSTTVAPPAVIVVCVPEGNCVCGTMELDLALSLIVSALPLAILAGLEPRPTAFLCVPLGGSSSSSSESLAGFCCRFVAASTLFTFLSRTGSSFKSAATSVQEQTGHFTIGVPISFFLLSSAR